ncbi:ATP-binding protein [Actinomadura formosensis]|uniref:ATP-binding protein n=1 Tax=Actinomadura formosensis TaxID=60706 RepID=UPI00082C2522|nr:ATP-binding protein [Actinomadura formosensis]
MNTWPHQSTLPLAALPNAAYWARRHTEDVLAKWSLEPFVMNAQLVVTEFVTNAVKHTGTLDVTAQQEYTSRPQSVSYRQLAGVATVRLRLSFGGGRLFIEVQDESNEPPVERVPDFVSEDGRGLYLVSAFCERWNWYPTFAAEMNGNRRQNGKVVWAEMGVSWV